MVFFLVRGTVVLIFLYKFWFFTIYGNIEIIILAQVTGGSVRTYSSKFWSLTNHLEGLVIMRDPKSSGPTSRNVFSYLVTNLRGRFCLVTCETCSYLDK